VLFPSQTLTMIDLSMSLKMLWSLAIWLLHPLFKYQLQFTKL